MSGQLPFCRVSGCVHRRRPNRIVCNRCYGLVDTESQRRLDAPSPGVGGEYEVALALGLAGDVLRQHLEAEIEKRLAKQPRWYKPPKEAAS